MLATATPRIFCAHAHAGVVFPHGNRGERRWAVGSQKQFELCLERIHSTNPRWKKSISSWTRVPLSRRRRGGMIQQCNVVAARRGAPKIFIADARHLGGYGRWGFALFDLGCGGEGSARLPVEGWKTWKEPKVRPAGKLARGRHHGHEGVDMSGGSTPLSVVRKLNASQPPGTTSSCMYRNHQNAMNANLKYASLQPLF